MKKKERGKSSKGRAELGPEDGWTRVVEAEKRKGVIGRGNREGSQ